METLYFRPGEARGNGIAPTNAMSSGTLTAVGDTLYFAACEDGPRVERKALPEPAVDARIDGTLWFAVDRGEVGGPVVALPAPLPVRDGTIYFAAAEPAARALVPRGSDAVMEYGGTLYLGREEPQPAADLWATDDASAGDRPRGGEPDTLLPVGGTFYFRAEEPAARGSLFGEPAPAPAGAETVLSLVRETDDGGRAVWTTGGATAG